MTRGKSPRLTFRYIHDSRRRRQFLLLRRFVTGFLISIVIVLGFISEFSSLATFAGFITAGIAARYPVMLERVARKALLLGKMHDLRCSPRKIPHVVLQPFIISPTEIQSWM